MYQLVFWQNIISPHQSDFIRSLAEKKGINVTLLVQSNIDPARKKMGWEQPSLGLARVIISPSKSDIREIIERNKGAVHIFSGTRGYPMVWYAFKYALKMDCDIGCMVEPGNWVGVKGCLRLIRSRFDALLINRKIKFLLAIGNKGVEWYTKSGYTLEKIFQWGYFLDCPALSLNEEPIIEGSFKIIYVGRLSKEKGVINFIKHLENIKDFNFTVQIIGEGSELESIKAVIAQSKMESKITILNFVPNDQVVKFISKADLLVLPSIGKDGWGAVINEALLVGTPVLCSSNCGASIMIKDLLLGEVFNPNSNPDRILEILKHRISEGKIMLGQRELIKYWAQNINGRAAAEYLVKILDFSFGKDKDRPLPPWIR